MSRMANKRSAYPALTFALAASFLGTRGVAHAQTTKQATLLPTRTVAAAVREANKIIVKSHDAEEAESAGIFAEPLLLVADVETIDLVTKDSATITCCVRIDDQPLMSYLNEEERLNLRQSQEKESRERAEPMPKHVSDARAWRAEREREWAAGARGRKAVLDEAKRRKDAMELIEVEVTARGQVIEANRKRLRAAIKVAQVYLNDEINATALGFRFSGVTVGSPDSGRTLREKSTAIARLEATAIQIEK